MDYRLIDTHAHLDLSHFDINSDDLLYRSLHGIFPEPVEEKIPLGGNRVKFVMESIIVPGITADSSKNCIEIAGRSPVLFAAVGIHPNSASETAAGDWETIERLANDPKTVAIGETGLDRYWDKTPLNLQIEYFERHIDLAKRKDLPIIIHCREADDELIPILKRESTGKLRGVIHSFSSDRKFAEICLDCGFYISFSGSVTYTNKKFAGIWDAATVVPWDRILIETDSPFLCPHPYRSKLERNEPLMVAFTAKRLAELRNCLLEEIVNQTTENAKKIFRLTPSATEDS